MAFCSSDPVYKEDLRSKIFLVLVKPSRERFVHFLQICTIVHCTNTYLEIRLYNANSPKCILLICLKGQLLEMVFLLHQIYLKYRKRGFKFFHVVRSLTALCLISILFAIERILHIRKEKMFLKDF
jgi:hypothetical protein